MLIGFGHLLFHVVESALCFGIGYGMLDANNMPIICQFVSSKHRATAYGVLNMTGVGCGALVTSLLGKSSDSGTLRFCPDGCCGCNCITGSNQFSAAKSE